MLSSKFYHKLRYYLDFKTRHTWRKFKNRRQEFYNQLWRDTAESMNASFDNWGNNYHRICLNDLTTIVSMSQVMLDSQLMLDLMGNKTLTYQLLEEKDLRVPRFLVFKMNSISKAQEFIEGYENFFVVKPASGTGGGKGVTTGISNNSDLVKASKLASRYSSTLLVEEFITGDSYRLLFLDGKYIDAIRRDSPYVIGDGKRTIKNLMSSETEERLSSKNITALSPLLIDQDCIGKLKSQGLYISSVPKKDQKIIVKNAVNENNFNGNFNVKDDVHSSIIEMCSKLVSDFGVVFAGIDLICSDITIPLSQSKGIINEVNTTPAIHHHYLINNKNKVTPVAEIVLEYMFSNKNGTMTL